MLFRGVGDDWISRIFLATSGDGFDFKINETPVISPDSSWESAGCEDPRITKIGNKFWMSYTAFDGITARSAIATSDNLISWKKRGLIFPHHRHPQREDLPKEWHKSAAMFPKKFKDKYLLLFGDNHIWSATSDDSINWISDLDPIISARKGFFDSAYVEMGPAPIKINSGWLVLYHGIDSFSSNRTYRLGAVILDPDNPLKIIARTNTPILEPKEIYEGIGLIDILPGGYSRLKALSDLGLEALASKHKLPKAVFCCGTLKEGNYIRIYYGAGDTRICVATVDIDTILSHM
jgi:predicted GH43/DUF377 family glycosyl hydrolase